MGGNVSRTGSDGYVGGYDPSPLPAPRIELREPEVVCETQGSVTRCHTADVDRVETVEERGGLSHEEASYYRQVNANLHTASVTIANDKLLKGMGPAELKALLDNPALDADAKAKVVAVMVERGGTASRDGLQSKGGYSSGVQKEMALRREYQLYATSAMTTRADAPAIFEALSRLDTLLPNGAHPASQFMQVLAQPGGQEAPRAVAEWMLKLPPEVRGRAYYHLIDAAHDAEKGEIKVTGATVNAGPLEVHVEYVPKDSEWRKNVKAIEVVVAREQERKASDVAAFQAGFRKASLTPAT